MITTRRKVLKSAGGMLALAGLQGCPIVKDPKPFCLLDDRFTNPKTALTIDVHNHIFNATDLQVANFVALVATRQSGGLGNLAKFFGELLQGFAWASAPSVRKELKLIAELRPKFEECRTGGSTESLEKLRKSKYEEGKAELNAAVDKALQAVQLNPEALEGPGADLSPPMQGLREIKRLADTYEELFSPTPEESYFSEYPEKKSIGSALQFMIEMFQYRFVSVYNCLDAYSNARNLKIDLLIPTAVDYDWWLSKGRRTRSSIPDQMKLAKEIAIITGGRVQSLVPFDPFRQVIHDLGEQAGFSPIELVKKSVEEYGVIGVKMYPPMGFAPFGNEHVAKEDPSFWSRRDWLPAIASREDFGKRLDDSLRQLYEYCAQAGVPIMGHSKKSNGPAEQFEEMAEPVHWARAVEEFPDTRFSFGHFGGAGSSSTFEGSSVRGFLDLMLADANNGAVGLAADASYFLNTLESPATLKKVLRRIYEYDADGSAISRLMYGADWKMLVAESDSEIYLESLDQVISTLESDLSQPDLRRKFFGQNAAEFYGLRKGMPNRGRLETFYELNGIRDAPIWMTKVDSQIAA